MSVPVKLAGFIGMLAAAFALALGAGVVAGPADEPASHGEAGSDHAGADAGGHSGTEGGGGGAAPDDEAAAASDLPGGLMIAQDGYHLSLEQRSLPAGTSVPLRFRIVGPDRAPVMDYTTAHEKDLHLIVVRRDLSGYQHVHPELDESGTWSVPLDLGQPGEYRVLADFVPAGRGGSIVLGADLSVAGDYRPAPLPAAVASVDVDGYTVTLEGTPTAGGEAELTLSVSKDGAPVTDLEPYLGAYGHLVALRSGDLAYLHVHPGGEPGDGVTQPGPDVTFYASVPSEGSYRLFFDFQHGGVVRTAEFTVSTDGAPADAAPAPAATTPRHDATPHDH